MDKKITEEQTFLGKVIDFVQHNNFSECTVRVDLNDDEVDVQIKDDYQTANIKHVSVCL
jgi:hypothetical protein